MNSSDNISAKKPIPFAGVHPAISILNMGRKSYICDYEKLARSQFRENYRVVRYIDSGWYSQIYEAQDIREMSSWAIKVIDRERPEGFRFPRDVRNLQKTKDEPSVIKIRESFDLGSTGIIVLELADADMMWQTEVFDNIKTDTQFRLLAKQLIEGIDALDRNNLFHPTIDCFDFLYVRKEGRVKVSALERAVEKENANNIWALEKVLSALDPIAKRLELSTHSKVLLKKLSESACSASELLKTEACTSLPKGLRLLL